LTNIPIFVIQYEMVCRYALDAIRGYWEISKFFTQKLAPFPKIPSFPVYEAKLRVFQELYKCL
jgi:hypothetical protein